MPGAAIKRFLGHQLCDYSVIQLYYSCICNLVDLRMYKGAGVGFRILM